MTSPFPSNAALDQERVSKLMQGIGVCLMQYQQIEAHLKMLLPHMRKPGLSDSTEQVLHWRTLIDSKVTLGPLVEQLKEKTNASDPDGVDNYLAELVRQRNDLVHHFLTDPTRPISSSDELESAIEQVRTYMHHAAPFVQTLRVAATQFVTALDTLPAENSFPAAFELPVAANSAP